MEGFNKYLFLFISGIVLILGLLLLIAFGMSPIVIILLALGVILCITSSILLLLGKTFFIGAKKRKQLRPKILSYEENYSKEENQKESLRPTIQKSKSSKTNSSSKRAKRPVLKPEKDYSPETSIKEENYSTKICPHCKYKNYSNEEFCQNCGKSLK